MPIKPLPKQETIDSLPPEWPFDLKEEIRRRVTREKRKIVVLDDDPTGTQTIHGLSVLTGWAITDLYREFINAEPAFYILTNSRSLTTAQARALNNEIGIHLKQAARQANRDFVVISRSDSTLRGHFPSELEALAEGLAVSFDAWLIAPFFLEGGRYTIADIHYVAEGESLIPAGQSEFARDAVFGYTSSDLREWIAEKTSEQISVEKVTSISLEDIRKKGPEHVANLLTNIGEAKAIIVNAASYRDLDVLVLGLLGAEARGRRFLYRSAASFVRARAGIEERPLLSPTDLELKSENGGLIVAGSYVPKTTQQIAKLLAVTPIHAIVVEATRLLDETSRPVEIQQAALEAEEQIAQGKNVIIYTSRTILTNTSEDNNLKIGKTISRSLVEIVKNLSVRPRFLLVKGGITSSDIATEALGVKKARVLGQILPGVPVWRLGAESRFPDMAYIIFPGNVGSPQALAEIVTLFR